MATKAPASPPRRTRRKRSDGNGNRTALVLQGGAALGAYEAGVIKALLESERRIEVVTGCSIGALMAAIVAGSRRDPVDALDDLWRRLAVPVNPFLPSLLARSVALPAPLRGDSLYRINPSYFAMPALATYLYESAPLAEALEEWVDFRRLNASPIETIVTAVEIRSGRLTEFSSRRGLKPAHVIASASLPPIFPPTQIGAEWYWDGGLISNTPLRPAINAIEAHDAVAHAREWELVVVDLFTPQRQPPKDMTDVIQRLFELVFFGKFQHDLKLYEWMNSQLDLMIEVDRALPKSSPVRKHPAYVKLARHRRVDKLTVIRTERPDLLGGPADFSPETIERRVKLGYEDARRALRR